MKVTINLPKKFVERLTKEAKDKGITLERLIYKELEYEFERLIDDDAKGTCHSGWYQGHTPKEPNDGERTICIKCGKGLVKYGLWGKWQIDGTKKALHLKGMNKKMEKNKN